MSALSRPALEELHAVLVASLRGILSDGVPVLETHRASGAVREVGRAPAPAPYVLAAVRLLKDNGVRAEPSGADPLVGLRDSLPRFPEDAGFDADLDAVLDAEPDGDVFGAPPSG